ncbi:MAG: hypothetical protein K0R67_2855 [Paenibacillus sp.]|nr:hypothetical protein [Paenibacillus sp.]
MFGLLFAKFTLLASPCYPHEGQTPGPADDEQGAFREHSGSICLSMFYMGQAASDDPFQIEHPRQEPSK